MTLQEIYDRVAKHLLAQNARSIGCDEYGSTYSCAYRGAEGFKCAIGCLIPDHLYDPKMETHSVRSIVRDHYALASLLGADGTSMCLLEQLQFLHDTKPVDGWYVALSEVARDFHLKPWEAV